MFRVDSTSYTKKTLQHFKRCERRHRRAVNGCNLIMVVSQRESFFPGRFIFRWTRRSVLILFHFFFCHYRCEKNFPPPTSLWILKERWRKFTNWQLFIGWTKITRNRATVLLQHPKNKIGSKIITWNLIEPSYLQIGWLFHLDNNYITLYIGNGCWT